MHLGRRRRARASGRLTRRRGTSRGAASAGSRRFDGCGGRDPVAGAVGRGAGVGGVASSRVGVVAVEGERECNRGYPDHHRPIDIVL